MAFDTPMIQILAFYLDFEAAKNTNVLYVLLWGFGGCWRFLTGVWHLDLDLDMATGLWYTFVPNFGSLSLFWRCKEPPCPLTPDLGLWRMLEVPNLGMISWSWFCYGQERCLNLPWSFDHTQIDLVQDLMPLQMAESLPELRFILSDLPCLALICLALSEHNT